MIDNYGVRPLMSGTATILISAGVVMLSQKELFGGLLLISGCALYAFKAYLYSKGFFITEAEAALELPDKNDKEGL